jgi:hypothetical protein
MADFLLGIGKMLNNATGQYPGYVVSAELGTGGEPVGILYRHDWLSPSHLSLAGWSQIGTAYVTKDIGRWLIGAGGVTSAWLSQAVYWHGKRYPHGGPPPGPKHCQFCGSAVFASYRISDRWTITAQYTSANQISPTYNGTIFSASYRLSTP